MAAMNESGFDDQAIFGHNRSVDCDYYYNYSHYNGNCTNYTGTGQQELGINTTLLTVSYVISYVSYALGIPGNILSAIVWLRRHVTSKNSSAIYLGVTAINDFVFLLFQLIRHFLHSVDYYGSWFYLCCAYLVYYTAILEPLLVLGFSVERLIAIVRPFQVIQLCTASRAKKVVAGFTVLVLAYVTIRFIAWQWGLFDVVEVLLYVDVVLRLILVPVSVLVINIIVIREVRRASRHSAANLGLQQHHQSTSSNSAVPTIMLIATSMVYALICGMYGTFHLAIQKIPYSSLSRATWDVLYDVFFISYALWGLVFAYNFYVYLITGKQFRSELYKLFRCCSTSSSAAAAAAVPGDNDDDARIARHAQNDTPV